MTDQPKVEAVIALFNQAYEETKRYEDMELRMAYWTVGLLVGVIGVTRIGPIVANSMICTQTLLAVFTVALGVYGVYRVLNLHGRLTWNRNLRMRCEKILGLFAVVEDGTSLLEPYGPRPVGYTQGLVCVLLWCGLIVLTMGYSLYSVWYMAGP